MFYKSHNIIRALIILVFVFFNTIGKSQLKQGVSKNIQYLIVPVFYKTPETGLAYGLSGSISFKASNKEDSLTRTSVIQGIGFFTTRHQNLQAIDASVYFPKEKYILLTQLSHSYYPDRFWGIGPNTKEDNDVKKRHGERYVYEQAYFFPHLKKKLKHHFFVGALYEFQNVYNIKYNIGERFDTSAFYGKETYRVSGVGVSMSYDTRNITFWPKKGLYCQVLITDFNKSLFSDYNLIKWITDLRVYKTIYKNQILATQFYNYVTDGNTPLRELASLGGSNNMRGFYQGRFRDKNMLTLISEYRTLIHGRFSACFFGGIGNVYNKIKDLETSDLKYSYGAGIRYALLQKEKLNIRVDYGFSSKLNKGLYVTVAECF